MHNYSDTYANCNFHCTLSNPWYIVVVCPYLAKVTLGIKFPNVVNQVDRLNLNTFIVLLILKTYWVIKEIIGLGCIHMAILYRFLF